MKKSATNFCILFLALVAVAWAQVAGLNHHYVCVCTGEPLEVSSDHCHAHGSALLTDADDHSHAEHEGHHDSQPHSPLKKELKAQKHTFSSPNIQAPDPVMLFDLPDFARPVLELTAAHDADRSVPPPGVSEGSPPTSLQVKECVVLLV
ncbi:MAG TPA: hypothetical protein VK956_06820 [Verrucomicrobium sp.]|nr:hypothetical protein [Verrucomicrobium sp.]